MEANSKEEECKGAIFDELKLLERNASELIESSRSLRERLAPVLCSASLEVKDAREAQVKKPCCPLKLRLGRVRENIARVKYIQEDIMSRLEIGA